MLLEVAESAAMRPENASINHILAVVHASAAGAVMGGAAAAVKEVGGAVDTLCSYLDTILVPLVLRQPALRGDAAQCPCERCLWAAQAVQRLTTSDALRVLTEAVTFPLLFKVIELAAKARLEDDDSSGEHRALQAAEALAVLGTYARLQEERWHIPVPPGTVHALMYLWRGGGSCASPGAFPGPMLLQVLHVVRNVSANHAEVMQMTAEVFGESGNQLWAALEALPMQEAIAPAPSKESSSSRQRASGGERQTDGLRRRRRESSGAAGAAAVDKQEEQWEKEKEPGEKEKEKPAVPVATYSGHGGNPQESDEYASGAEVGPYPGELKEQEAISEAEPEQAALKTPTGSVGTASGSEDTAGSSTSAPPDPRAQCAELLSLYSLVLQALFQTDEALRQRLFVSEEAIRLQMVIMTRALRTSELLPKWQQRLAFQGIRMYLLVCRSSHIRKQYIVLQRSFVEEERRAVAFLLSLTPPAQRCCVLLRAMAQDVHSWLLWQAQASARAGPACPRLKPASQASQGEAPGQPAQRSSKSRASWRQQSAADSGAPGADARPAAPDKKGSRSSAKASRRSGESSSPPRTLLPSAAKHRKPKPPPAQAPAETSFADVSETLRLAAGPDQGAEAAADAAAPEPERPEPERQQVATNLTDLFTSGEAVWTLHALLVLVVVLCLVAIWRSLETPKGPLKLSDYNFWRKNL